ncbi:MAG: prephenate dehydrogenase/arogenate dehydrogenase family protein [Candidatus Tantalella remota]|nr:prephenate dehydrogenase/arogenate dehydrogenase family protein [Candidatus Tantalella remota]
MKYKRITIIGMGLIGGSVGKALMEGSLAEEVIGVCRRQSSLDRAIKGKSLTKGYVNNYEEATAGAEIVIIATPVHTENEVLEGLAFAIKDPATIVTDAGSTKKVIVDTAAGFSDKFSFVGGHPLAGSEKAGVEYSDAGFFQGSLCVLTKGASTVEKDIESVKELWQAIGADVEVTTPEKHDEILSFTSHLPHIVAYALSGVQKEEYFKYMSTGFKDTTRIAASDPRLWKDIFLSNRDNVLSSVACLRELLSEIEKSLRNNREEDLEEILKMCKKVRDEAV